MPHSRWVLAGALLMLAPGCKPKDPAITEPFSDDFERAELGPSWHDTGADYRIVGGKLTVKGAHNHPVWLRRKLPRDVVVELDMMSRSPAGDLKIELFGDGESYDPDGKDYVSTAHMLIFGGWNNSLSVICRNNEHDEGRKSARQDVRVVPGRTYRWTVSRRGGAVDWKIDGQPFLAWNDPSPLAGGKHLHDALVGPVKFTRIGHVKPEAKIGPRVARGP